MVQPAHPASTDDLDRFDPERFRIEQPGADPLVEAIPVDETIVGRDRMAGRFAIVPLAAVRYFPPAARILLMLTYVQRLYSPDIDGGWYRLRTGIATDFHLRDKDVRRHALAALEKAGVIEVLRHAGQVALYPAVPRPRRRVPASPRCVPSPAWRLPQAHSRGLRGDCQPRPRPGPGRPADYPSKIPRQ